jgi:hypothetical protein
MLATKVRALMKKAQGQVIETLLQLRQERPEANHVQKRAIQNLQVLKDLILEVGR